MKCKLNPMMRMLLTSGGPLVSTFEPREVPLVTSSFSTFAYMSATIMIARDVYLY